MNRTNRAKNLKEAYQVCNLDPLKGETIKLYYVDLSKVRNTKAIAQVDTILDFKKPEEFTTILFTGHRGCGKSTELRRIEERWQEKYFIVYLETDREIDIQDARYIDLYLVLIKQIEYEIRQRGIKFNDELLSNFEAWFKEITQETEETVEKSVSMSGTLDVNSSPFPIPFVAKLLVKLLAQIKGSDKRKTTIRQTLEQDISRLQADVNFLLDDGFKKIQHKFPQYQGFLVIFDNLDLVTPGVGDHLFFDYAAQLQALRCNIIYTVPISAIYSAKRINNFFDNSNIVPMINIYNLQRDEADLSYQEEALKAVAELIKVRVNIEDVFADEEDLLSLAKASGGHVRQLMQMMRTAIISADSKGSPKIDSEDVQIAIKRVQFDFERTIPDEHYIYLANVYLKKEINNNQIGQDMLFNTSALEYNGSDRWNYINPVVKYIEAFKKALENVRK
ncbi:ATP-binding protein [Crocosphaera sp. Alani8]|uniref:ATP-binding protein n=1 Tax=Crocosphaera sp. Alani8 TaxID=3038952 RepID=UPI00313B225D